MLTPDDPRPHPREGCKVSGSFGVWYGRGWGVWLNARAAWMAAASCLGCRSGWQQLLNEEFIHSECMIIFHGWLPDLEMAENLAMKRSNIGWRLASSQPGTCVCISQSQKRTIKGALARNGLICKIVSLATVLGGHLLKR